MALKWYLVSTTHPGIAFEIVKLDKATMRATLLGETGVPFEQEVSQDKLDKYHYQIVRRDADLMPAAPLEEPESEEQ